MRSYPVVSVHNNVHLEHLSAPVRAHELPIACGRAVRVATCRLELKKQIVPAAEIKNKSSKKATTTQKSNQSATASQQHKAKITKGTTERTIITETHSAILSEALKKG